MSRRKPAPVKRINKLCLRTTTIVSLTLPLLTTVRLAIESTNKVSMIWIRSGYLSVCRERGVSCSYCLSQPRYFEILERTLQTDRQTDRLVPSCLVRRRALYSEFSATSGKIMEIESSASNSSGSGIFSNVIRVKSGILSLTNTQRNVRPRWTQHPKSRLRIHCLRPRRHRCLTCHLRWGMLQFQS